MSDIDVRDRSSVLDAFASARPEATNLPAPGQSFGMVVDRPIGAQKVAVHRDDGAVLQKLRALAAAAGQDWYYRIPVRNRKENRLDYIEGPSIKLANDLARMYGNCEVDTRVQDLGDAWLIYARFTDIETGFAMTRPFQQRKSQRSIGGGDEARALDIALQIGVSKAIRNVIVNALQTFADFAYEEARSALVDKIGKNLAQYRTRVVERLGSKGIELRRVEAVVGRVAGEWLAPDVAKVIAMVKSVEDGMATLDETFPALVDKATAATEGETTTAGAGQANSATEQARAGSAHDPATGEVDPADSAPGDGDEAEADAAPADPREALIAEIRSEIMTGERRVVAILNDLGGRRDLLTDADVAALKRAEKDLAKQQNGGAR